MLRWLDRIGDALDTVRFGATPPALVSTPPAGPPPTVTLPVLTPGARLQSLPDLLRSIGKIPPHAVEDALRAMHPVAAAQLGQALETAPIALFKVVRDAIDHAATATLPANDPTLAALRRAGLDPRSAQEAAAALDTALRHLAAHPMTQRLVNEALEVLEDRGALGSQTLETVGKLALAALGVGGAQVVQYLTGGQVGLRSRGLSPALDRVGDVGMGLDKLGAYVGSLRLHDPAWAGAAVDLVVRGQAKALALDSKHTSGGAEMRPDVGASATFPLVQTSRFSASVQPEMGVNLEGDVARAKLHGMLASKTPARTLGASGFVGAEASRAGARVSAGADLTASGPLDERHKTRFSTGLGGSVAADVEPHGEEPEVEGHFTTTLRF